jgi:hypothetical protein
MAKLEAVANSDGGFQFLQLAPAEYSLMAEASGFKKFQANRVQVLEEDDMPGMEILQRDRACVLLMRRRVPAWLAATPSNFNKPRRAYAQ